MAEFSLGMATTVLPIAMAGRMRERRPRSWGVVGCEDADGADGFVHGEGDHAGGRVVDRAFEFVGPCGISEGAVDAVVDFDRGLFGADEGGEFGDDFVAALDEVFGDEVENLGAAMSGVLRPFAGGACGFDGVADVLAAAEGSFADEAACMLTEGRVDGVAVAGVGANLFAADVLLDGAIDGREFRGF